ncbi:MAG TPA: hypothetical protein VM344_04845 [Vitreimonas sp.]|nr:hypothetical protein [Vitreimonas sp.]
MTVPVPLAGGHHGDPRPHHLEEGVRGGRAAAVMGDLEQIELGQAARNERWIDLLLDVAGQQEPSSTDFAKEDDGHVVDARPAVGRFLGDGAAVRPQDGEPDLVDGQSIAGEQVASRDSRCGETRKPGAIAGARPAHSRLQHPPDAVALQQQGEAGDMILVWVAQDQCVESAVPRRQPLVKRQEQAIGVRAAVDQDPPAPRALDEDGVALPDVEHDDRRPAGRAMDHHEAREGDRYRDACEAEPAQP